ncbi:LytR C-terminal domain-containing protein [Streptomyces sp. F63]|uniref:LCP family protein n=1 Tax=Streptomyces sp. F63 TaxID=2824887 RepID=UPI0027DE775D|nr:LytR C-terminal domain-containing protein [Streptomyces sp. F63]
MNDAHSGRYGRPEDGRDPYVYDPYTQQYYDPSQGGGDPAQAGQARRPDQPEHPYDPYGAPYGEQGRGSYDPYGYQQPQQYDAYGRPHQPYPDPRQQGYDSAAYGAAGPGTTGQRQQHPRQAQPGAYESPYPYPAQQAGEETWVPPQQTRTAESPGGTGGTGGGAVGGEDPGGYRTEQFSFIEEPDEAAEDVIDWLKFAETRTERRDERKRKGRNRLVALVVVLVLALAGGAGYLWYAGKLPGLSGAGAGAEAAGGPQKRDVIIVHLRHTKDGGSSTALLVDNETTGKGTTLLLPNALAVSAEGGGSTTLGSSVEEDGNGPTRDALNTLLGSEIEHSWRLDTPYLENLVELVGGITVDTDADVPGEKKGEEPLARKGKDVSLGGRAAVGYATLLRKGEDQTDQLQRFGRVLRAVLRKMPGEAEMATETVRSLNQIADPSLTEAQLGASLAELGEQAKGGEYATELLPVRPDGTLAPETADTVVKDVLGGKVTNADPDAAPRISVRNATGDDGAAEKARVALVNGGYTVVNGGSADAAQQLSEVTYTGADRAAEAKEIAVTLGLPESAVQKGKGASNADVTVVLGRDYPAGADSP